MEKTKEQINTTAAASIVSEAEAVAKNLIDTASRAASRLTESNSSEDKTTKILANALREVFGEHEEAQRFIDTKRIPLICKDIANMNKSIEDIKDSMKWLNRLILGAVILAILGLVLVKP